MRLRAWSRRGFPVPVVLVTMLFGCSVDRPPVEPVDPDPEVEFVAISAGQDHACAIDTRGYAYCWGRNSAGQLGDGTTTDRLQPTLVSSELSFASIGAGFAHTCGLTTEGAVLCWGGNRTGQLGDGTTTDRPTPGPVQGGHAFAALAVGSYHVCAATTAGATYCWGAAGLSTDYGALGAAATGSCAGYHAPASWPCSTVPQQVPGGHEFESVSAGVFYACGVTRAEEAYCWGWNVFSQLGNGSGASSGQPTAVAGGAGYQAVDAGGGHACGIRGGAGYCWGEAPNFGQLGNGSFSGSSTPVPVAGGIVFRSLRPSRGDTYIAHTCGVAADGTAYCWGMNGAGQLGSSAEGVCNVNSMPLPCTSTPLRVAGELEFQDVSTGAEFTCGVTTAGTAYCWGRNEYGQLGTGARNDAAVPVPVVMP